MAGLDPAIHIFAYFKDVYTGHSPGMMECIKICAAKRRKPYTGNAMEYFTWLSAKLDSMEAMPSSRVNLFLRNAS